MSAVQDNFSRLFAFMDENPEAIKEALSATDSYPYVGGPRADEFLFPGLHMHEGYPLLSTWFVDTVHISNQLVFPFMEEPPSIYTWQLDSGPSLDAFQVILTGAGEIPPLSFSTYVHIDFCVAA